eukprot:scaffold210590_cov17-Tisochrysis_lutea.AAC.1
MRPGTTSIASGQLEMACFVWETRRDNHSGRGLLVECLGSCMFGRARRAVLPVIGMMSMDTGYAPRGSFADNS